ncbi:MAG: GLPGLI family protein [Saprospiraceae bacterium]
MKNIFILIYVLVSNNIISQNSNISMGDSIPVGRVVYEQIIHSPYFKHLNGKAELCFNATRSSYSLCDIFKGNISYKAEDGLTVNDVGDSEGFPILKLHNERVIYYKTHTVIDKKMVVVRDTLGNIPWVIYNEFKRFGPYKCQKAIGYFRGRTYEAWFTPDIPIPSGPFKLGGLPGLILEAKSIDGQIEFLFSNLEFSPSLTQTIKVPHGKYLDMNYTDLQLEEERYMINWEKEAKARGSQITVSKAPGTIEIGN